MLIPFEQDTLVGISQYDFDLILFSFSYMKSLEKGNNIASKEILRRDSIIAYMDKVLALEAKKSDEKDSIILNLEEVIKDQKKKARKEKLKNTFTVIGLGILAGAEAGVITYLLLR